MIMPSDTLQNDLSITECTTDRIFFNGIILECYLMSYKCLWMNITKYGPYIYIKKSFNSCIFSFSYSFEIKYKHIPSSSRGSTYLQIISFKSIFCHAIFFLKLCTADSRLWI